MRRTGLKKAHRQDRGQTPGSAASCGHARSVPDCGACGLSPGHPARVGFGHDGRSPDLRVAAFPAFPAHARQWHSGVGSPLTVAGAVVDLAPDGYTAPRSLFTRFGVADPGTIAACDDCKRRSGQREHHGSCTDKSGRLACGHEARDLGGFGDGQAGGRQRTAAFAQDCDHGGNDLSARGINRHGRIAALGEGFLTTIAACATATLTGGKRDGTVGPPGAAKVAPDRRPGQAPCPSDGMLS